MLAQLLVEQPQNSAALTLDSLCLSLLDKFEEGLSRAELAIAEDPDNDSGHYARGVALLGLERLDPALAAARELLRLDPQDSRGYLLRAQVFMQREKWELMLDTVELGLEAEPEDLPLRQMRVQALSQLGRGEEADAELRRMLSDAPEDAMSHAQFGWLALEKKQYREAAEQFRESLRLDPGDNESARAGLIEALKARNPIYRLLLSYLFWTSKLSDGAQWGVILGAWFGYRLIRNITKAYPSLAPIAYIVTALYLGIVLTTWLGAPLCNLMLRLSPEGKHLLNDEERFESHLIGASLGLGVLCVVLGLVSREDRCFIPGAGLILLCMPITIWFADQRRRRSGIFVGLLLAAVLVATALAWAMPEAKLGGQIFAGTLGLMILSTWVGPALLQRLNRR